MSRRITHKRLSGGSTHEHIVAVAYLTDGVKYSATTPEMVRFIEGGGVAYTLVNSKRADVGVKTSSSGRKYLQTHADGYWNNNLLALPDF